MLPLDKAGFRAVRTALLLKACWPLDSVVVTALARWFSRHSVYLAVQSLVGRWILVVAFTSLSGHGWCLAVRSLIFAIVSPCWLFPAICKFAC